ncbi:glycosyltransferase [Pseudomonas putida]|uniref:Glycosyltransferase n=1 Tax=Pseudomonas putida TaxID=303 RepID=A0A2Z4RU22_PSEPU|nr:glycosyltransferase [Pseudomonas putida]AWY43344.1 glycosyltransferase [Pseudomonas putida]
MSNFFSGLFISSPNKGGLFLVDENKVYKLDDFSTTGLSRSAEYLVRGSQPASLFVYGEQTLEITESNFSFHDIHDALVVGEHVYLVATTGNEIIKLSMNGVEEQRWVFPGEVDSLHINCLAVWGGAVVFSAFGAFSEHRGYKGNTKGAGYVQDLNTGNHLVVGLSQPHSLTTFGENLLIANSEQKELCEYSPSGELLRSKSLGGYTRGVCVSDKYIYVGLSKSRNINASGVETATLVCLDIESWHELGRIQIPSDEIYSVELIADKPELLSFVAKISSSTSYKYSAMVGEQEKKIAGLDQAIAESEQKILGLGEVVSERERHIAILKDSVKSLETQISHLNHTLESRDQWMAKSTQLSSERQRQIEELETLVLERNGRVMELNKLVEARETQLAEQSLVSAQRDRSIAESKQKILGLGEIVGEREKHIALLKDSVSELEKLVLEHNNRVLELNKLAGTRAAQLEEQDIISTQRDKRIAELTGTILEYEQKVLTLEANVKGQERVVLDLSKSLDESHEKVKELDDLLVRKEEHIETLDQSIVAKNQGLFEFEQALSEAQAKLHILDELFLDQDLQIADLDERLVNNEKSLLASGQALIDEQLKLEALNTVLGQRDEQNVHLTQSIAIQLEEISILSQTLAERESQVARLTELSLEQVNRITYLEQSALEGDKKLSALSLELVDHQAQKEEVIRRGLWALRLTEELKAAQEQVSGMGSSNSWRLTMPLREASRWVFSPIQQSKRYVKLTLKSLKRMYQKLPFKSATKAAHRNFVIKNFPFAVTAADMKADAETFVAGARVIELQECSDLEGLAANISIDTSSRPLVSIVIPIYGKCDFTLRCLASVALNTTGIPFEVIVVDDCSPDNSVELLQAVNGIRLVCNETNQGFIRSCNAGAQAAKGKYVCFLNNDTEVMPRWLEELVNTFHEFPGTGLAGSKLVYPDGTLQEAGGLSGKMAVLGIMAEIRIRICRFIIMLVKWITVPVRLFLFRKISLSSWVGLMSTICRPTVKTLTWL